jgi:hypothetical protein
VKGTLTADFLGSAVSPFWSDALKSGCATAMIVGLVLVVVLPVFLVLAALVAL